MWVKTLWLQLFTIEGTFLEHSRAGRCSLVSSTCGITVTKVSWCWTFEIWNDSHHRPVPQIIPSTDVVEERRWRSSVEGEPSGKVCDTVGAPSEWKDFDFLVSRDEKGEKVTHGRRTKGSRCCGTFSNPTAKSTPLPGNLKMAASNDNQMCR